MFFTQPNDIKKISTSFILMLSIRWTGCRGSGPSPRTKHCATMYDDRYLLVFGGASKSKPLNDLFALDFETVRDSSVVAAIF